MDLKGKIIGYDKKILVVAGLLLIIAGIFFYAGAKYEKHKLSALGLLVDKSEVKKDGISLRGFLTEKDDESVTIKLIDGTSKIIPFSAATTFGANENGQLEDLLIGQLLVIAGKNSPDGTFVAENIRKSKKSPK